MGWAPSVCEGPQTASLRGLWVSGLLPPGNGGTHEGGDPETDVVTQEADSELPGCQSKEKAAQLPQKRGTLETAWVASVHKKGGVPETPLREREGTQGPWRRGATGCSMMSRQLLQRNGWTVARIGPFVIFVSLLEKRSVELMGCPVCFFRPASRGLPVAEALDENVTKSHIPLSVQSSLSFLGKTSSFSRCRGCGPFQTYKNEVYHLSKALNGNVTKFHIPHSVQSSPSATTFSRDKKVQNFFASFSSSELRAHQMARRMSS